MWEGQAAAEAHPSEQAVASSLTPAADSKHSVNVNHTPADKCFSCTADGDGNKVSDRMTPVEVSQSECAGLRWVSVRVGEEATIASCSAAPL